MEKSKAILVTGGAGYIGSHTVVALAEEGFFPIILDNFSNTERVVLGQLSELTNGKFKHYEGDVRNASLLREIFKENAIIGVIHFAAYKAVGESVAEPEKYYRNNLEGLLVLLEEMNNAGLKQLVFSSSCTVYGNPMESAEVDENSPLGIPNSPYGWTKWMGEQIIKDIVAVRPIQAVILRYFNPIGAHPSGLIGELPKGVPNNLLPYITQVAVGLREQLTVFGNDYDTIDGTCIRDYLHVMDLAHAHVAALKIASSENPAIFNIGTGCGTSVLELIAAFEQATHQQLNWAFGPKRAGDVAKIYANASKANTVLNWKAQYSIQDAVRHAWNFEQKRTQ